MRRCDFCREAPKQLSCCQKEKFRTYSFDSFSRFIQIIRDKSFVNNATFDSYYDDDHVSREEYESCDDDTGCVYKKLCHHSSEANPGVMAPRSDRTQAFTEVS